jgi:hypothetical protein
VNGRLVVPVETGVTFAGVDPSNGSCLTGVTPSELPDTAGGVTQPFSVIDPADVQLGAAAPAMVGSIVKDATAKPEPMINRLAHIMIALLPAEVAPLRFPVSMRATIVTCALVPTILPCENAPSQSPNAH